MVLQQIAFALGLALKIFSVYFLIISLFALKTPKKYPVSAPQYKFAIMIAARNEAAVIGELVRSLQEQNYPKEYYDIFVVPNNCNDNTEEVARRSGAKIIQCALPVKNKGDALRQSLAQMLSVQNEFDAFIVFDADNVVDKNYLSEMNNAFCAGAKVAKGRNEAKNPYDSWVAGCYAIYYSAFNVFFNRPRASCGLSAKLVGTGFAFHRSVIEKTGGWNTITVTEDAEFSSQCAIDGERICWVPKAVTYEEAPNSFRQSLTQRKRWCSGIMQVAGLKIPELLKTSDSKNRALRMDMFMFLLAPFAQVFSVLPLALTALLSAFGAAIAMRDFVFLTLISIAVAYAATTVFAASIAFICGKRDIRILKGVFSFAIFMASWLPLLILSLFKKTTTWKEIHHTRSILLENVD